MTRYRNDTDKLYRERNGLVFGVFKGLSTWSGLPVWAFRIAGIVLLLGVGFWKVTALYVLAALLMPPRY
jgi:phage shock protein PspC (stress-responsive transcriptional regulator)